MQKFVLSVLVENHAGVLSRVSGLFSRRGYNIDSLTVCETSDKAISRMTIVVMGDDRILDQIEKQARFSARTSLTLAPKASSSKRREARQKSTVSSASWSPLAFWNTPRPA